MKRTILVLAILCCFIVPGVSADEQSDAEAALGEAGAMLDTLDSWSSSIGPALSVKMKAEPYLFMARESFEAGEYVNNFCRVHSLAVENMLRT